MLVRNVGPHLLTDIVRLDGQPVYETMVDAMITSLAAKHNLLGRSTHTNSRAGSIYIVKPKMHGPSEVVLAVELFDAVEAALGLEPNTIKMGIMDEERRTSLGL
jgi:malate synthase